MECVRIDMVPEDLRSTRGIMETYEVSRITAWRLVSGAVSHIKPGYHKKITYDGPWDLALSYRDYIRGVAYRLCRAWSIPYGEIDDIVSDSLMALHDKTAVVEGLNEFKQRKYAYTITRRNVLAALEKKIEKNFYESEYWDDRNSYKKEIKWKWQHC